MLQRLKQFFGQSSSRSGFSNDFVLDFLAPEFIQNPYPALRYLQRHDPIHRAKNGAWVVTRHADVESGLFDSRLGNKPSYFSVLNEKNAERYPCAAVANRIIPFMDGEKHKTTRVMVGKSFLSYLRSAPIHNLSVDWQLASDMSNSPSVDQLISTDCLAHFATPYTLSALSALLGLPAHESLKRWTSSFIYLFSAIPSEDARQRIDQDLLGFQAYCEQLIENMSINPTGGWLQAAVENDKVTLSTQSLANHLMLLYVDGIENIDRAIVYMVYFLLSRHLLADFMSADNEHKKRMVDEALRLESPAQYIGRVAKEDMVWHGQSIKKGQSILLMLAAANRDASVFEQPDEFDLSHHSSAILSFGKGAHACLGTVLAKELVVKALTDVFSHYPNITLAQNELIWENRLGHRWLSELHVHFN